MNIELHCHSNYSDGSTEVKDIVKLAKSSNISALAITDHDTFNGYLSVKNFADEIGIELINGIEISAIDNKTKRRVHVLGYMCDTIDELTLLCNNTLSSRNTAGLYMFDKIKKSYGINIDMVKRYSSKSNCIYKQHIMHALIDAGYTLNIYGDLYNKLFNKENGIAYCPINYPDVREVVSLIKKAHGICVIAHCSQFDSFDLIQNLYHNDMIDGVEVYHYRNTVKDKTRLLKFSKENNLLVTGGTDFHGFYSSSPFTLGSNTTPESEFKKMKKLKSMKG